jgi:hypothetical protein
MLIQLHLEALLTDFLVITRIISNEKPFEPELFRKHQQSSMADGKVFTFFARNSSPRSGAKSQKFCQQNLYGERKEVEQNN